MWLDHIFPLKSKEAVVLAKWLAKVCLDVAIRNPDDEHAQLLGLAIEPPTSASTTPIVFLNMVPNTYSN